MKSLPAVLFACISLSASAADNSGWTLQRITSFGINAVNMTPAGSGIAVGARGSVYYTVNRGEDWDQGYVDPNFDDLYDVWFTTETSAIAVGANGTIVRTVDGGARWSRQVSGTTGRLLGVSFGDTDRVGTAVGANGTILHTTDGGETWVRQAPKGVDFDLVAVFFADADRGWVTGRRPSHLSDIPYLLSTSDGGTTWLVQSQRGGGRLFFADVSTGWMIQSGRLLHTTDGGVTWTPQITPTECAMTALAFSDANTGNAVGDCQFTFRNVLRTIDGGETWSPQAPAHVLQATRAALNGVSFADADHGVAVGNILFASGAVGVIMSTASGGNPIPCVP